MTAVVIVLTINLMADQSHDELKARISQLEKEVSHREQDLKVFREELAVANQQLEKLIAGIQHDLKLSQAIQKALVPTELPNIQGIEFSSKFVPSPVKGGDYFDIFEHEDRAKFGMIVAGSSGHAMSALLLSVLLKLTGQMEARKGSEPHVVVQLMVNELAPHIEVGESADVFYGMFNRRDFVLSYCRVGEVVALVQEYGSGELKALTTVGGPIEKGFNAALESATVALNPRDRLIFCTPGVVNATNLQGEPFGQDRLFKAILNAPERGVHELRNEVLYQVQNYLGGQAPPRDLTVVVAEVKDRVIKLAKS
ncbi:MAG: SpoIIE family protein phosphatase [Pseudobdellovibrionaceae bacterium]|nr:MAG: SpoIIE family protein phosphatase [Pseudobdellovibrionaceae bacterium]